ncbi:MAG TPA: universal stress protein [Thermodesulfobacteriota bacterium]|nr:universal stress protein [Thermodesulfobacteriota bacterium]
MIKLDRILWTTDGSKDAEFALNYAKLFARSFNSEIIGLHVIKVIDKRVWSFLGGRIDLKGWAEDAASKWLDLFEEVKEDLEREGISFTYRVMTGSPHEVIVRVANDEKADLIVMGKRGLGLKDRLLVGSSTIKVLERSRIPVLAIKGKGGRSLPRIRKILVPFDVSERFDSALKYAISLGKAFDAIVSLVYVLELISYPYEFPLGILNEMRSAYDKELEERIAELSPQEGDGVKIKHKVIESINPYLGIIGYAESEKVDLIVMNTHGRRGIKRLILGSVAEKVIQEAPCSILALKPSR